MADTQKPAAVTSPVDSFRLGYDDWPAWWTNALDQRRAEHYERDYDLPETARIFTDVGSVDAERGDWIVQNSDGSLSVYGINPVDVDDDVPDWAPPMEVRDEHDPRL